MDAKTSVDITLAATAISNAFSVISQQQSSVNLAHTLFDQRIPDEEFKKRLRLSRDTFWMLVRVCDVNITRGQTRFRASLSPEKVLAVGLYRLAHGASYQVCADTFNIGKTTVHEAFFDVVTVLNTVKNRFIRFPATLEKKVKAINTFKSRSEMPNVLGAIDGTHIKIKAPIENKKDYFSRYQRYDVVCQGIVDGDMKFLDIVVGFPGSIHDARVLRNTKISKLLDRGFQEPKVAIGEDIVSPYFVGDSAYPLMESLIKPYSESTTDPAEKKFNRELPRARSRFRILLHGCDDKVKIFNQTIIACCVLHNFCLQHDVIWEDDDADEQPISIIPGSNTFDGEELRDKLKEYINKTLIENE
eukprot:gene7619-8459_t